MQQRAWWLLVALSVYLDVPASVLASGVVGDGTAGSCTEAALATAMAGGGTVTFNCGAAPATIALSTPVLVSKRTTVDGGGRIALRAANPNGFHFFEVMKGGSLNLANLTARDGGAPFVVVGRGRASVTNCTLANNTGPGALSNNVGRVTVARTTFTDNALAIYNDGTLTVESSTFDSGSNGAITTLRGKVTVSQSTFSNNGGYTDALAGAIFSDGSRLSVTNSRFSNNRALSSGAIYNRTGRLSVTNCSFTSNSNAGAVDAGIGSGGAIFNGDRLTIEKSTFANNRGGANDGGAVYNGGRLTVANSTFANNRAGSGGGGAIFNGAPLTIVNSTFAGNGAPDSGGTLFGSSDTVTLKNTIVANSSAGENCAGPVAVIDGGHNLDSESSCGFTDTKNSLSNSDPRLDPAGLADNGGPTYTIAVEADSPAISAGSAQVCTRAPVRNLDQRSLTRPGLNSASCTIGAYEYWP